MTSVSGAGYQSKKQGTFDPLNQGHGPAPALAEKADNGPEDLAKELERQVGFRFSQNSRLVVYVDYAVRGRLEPLRVQPATSGFPHIKKSNRRWVTWLEACRGNARTLHRQRYCIAWREKVKPNKL